MSSSDNTTPAKAASTDTHADDAVKDTYSFIVVANRLPVDIEIDPDGTKHFEPSPGGLVTALKPVLKEHEGAWIGWPGATSEGPTATPVADPFMTDEGITLIPMGLTKRDYSEYYEGFSNATLWPLYHDLIVTPIFNRDWWVTYRDVNTRFAMEVARRAAEGATVWVQDYQLQLLPGILRQMRPDLKIGFFLHIPFPPAELFRQLPWREELVRGLLGADVIGFHSIHNATNFLELSRDVGGFATPSTGQPDSLPVRGKASMREITATITASDGRPVGVGVFPISIDTKSVTAAAKDADAEKVRSELGNPETLILGVDRLDYTKGILQRLEAYEELLETGALDPETTTFVQVATPSRERIEHYKVARRQVEEAVGRINGHFSSIGHSAVTYMHRSIPFPDLVSYYKAADIMLVTSLKDGMNLVAKEYVACHPDGTGSLVLSEFTGAAAELDGAFLCNPHDIDSIKRQVHSAAVAKKEDLRDRMISMFNEVTEHDVHAWASAFLDCLESDND
ncbi:alpha,alpha-trehalose-phosphate synthase (UDP-forming) [Corynebacterium kroppenstedtii]